MCVVWLYGGLSEGACVVRSGSRDNAERRSGREHPAARRLAVDPSRHVVLEASAGTGKTSVLVARYVNLLGAGVDPANILAMTFTRKAAAEMRERIMGTLRQAAATSETARRQWMALRDRLSDVHITTIDAFCLSLLREFPLEADLDPGFGIADETEAPRLMEQALDRAQRIFGALVPRDEGVALLLTRLGATNLRTGLVWLLRHRLVAPRALRQFLANGPTRLTLEQTARDTMTRLRRLLESAPGGLQAFLADGPTGHPRFRMLAADLRRLDTFGCNPADVRSLLDRLSEHVLTRAGKPRQRTAYARVEFPSSASRTRHVEAVRQLAPAFAAITTDYRRGVGVVLARTVWRVYRIAEREYRQTLRQHAVLDFIDVQRLALGLLRQMDEFAQSRYRLESRYHHVLVDEFQDTSRAQWELVSLLVQSWGEGVGLVQDAPVPPSIFVVGDRKQSIYRFRDADVSLFAEAGDYIGRLRPGSPVRTAITRSFRAVPGLLRFVNDLSSAIEKVPGRSDAFRYDGHDRFPLTEDDGASTPPAPTEHALLGLAMAEDETGCAEAVASEIERLLAGVTVRDPRTGVRRSVRPDDIAVLFRARASHREYERVLSARGVPVYVYRGLGFFGADEIQDFLALMRFLAHPASDFWAAAFLRSGFVRLSDEALRHLAPGLAQAIAGAGAPAALESLPALDRRRLELARVGARRWLGLVDRLPPAELVDRAIRESAYLYELRGPRVRQARENLKKMRSLVRRIQNRGYATLARIADHVDHLSTGDESNATIDAAGTVHMMTIHAAKGLEFPIVFVVGLSRGVGGARAPIHVLADRGDGLPSVTVGGSAEEIAGEIDDEERARALEETKRLLYVAVTRARDALYLSMLRSGDRVVAGRGSLADVLPVGFVRWLESVPSGAGVADWRGDEQSAAHRFRLC